MNNQLRIPYVVCLLASMLGGCTYLQPLVSLVDDSRPLAGRKEDMPQLHAAVASVGAKLADIEKKRDNAISNGRWLDIATFGLGVGAAGASLNPGHTNAVRNLTFAGGAAFAGSGLFAPRDVAMVYHAGVGALICVKNKGSALATTAVSIQQRLQADGNVPAAYVMRCDASSIQDKVDAAVVAKDRLRLSLAYIQGADEDQARAVRQAANGAINEMNAQVLARANSPAAIMDAAKSLLQPLPSGAGTASTLGGARSTGVAGGSACSAEVGSLLEQFTADYARLEKILAAAANVVSSLDTSCAVAVTAMAALSLSQDKVTVGKDVTFNITVSGGRLPYRLRATGTQTTDVDVRLVQPSTVVVTGKSTIKAARSSSYVLEDNSSLSTPVTLTVTTQAPSGP